MYQKFNKHSFASPHPSISRALGNDSLNLLDAAHSALVCGDLALWELPFEVRAFYFAGFNDSESHLKPKLEQLRHEAAMYYERWMNPGKQLSDMKQRRIEEALTQAYQSGELITEADVLRISVAASRPTVEKRAS